MQSEHNVTLLTTGVTMGILHVLAGPDHLSALAALAVGTSWRAFMLGFRWGIGHSAGLIVVAIVFISLKGDLDLRSLGRYCDSLVGIFMIALGCFGVIGALKTFREKRNKRDPDLNQSKLIHISLTPNSSSILSDDIRNISVISESEVDDVENTKNSMQSPDHEHNYSSILEDCQWFPFIDMHDPATQRLISFFIGLLHGVAGPGGILGVLPAVEMQNWQSSFLYLGSFILTSTLSMGIFAALYGEITKRIGATAESVELGLSVFSAAMSIIVGTIWLVLSLLGKLDTYFH